MLCLGTSVAVIVVARVLQGISATIVWVAGLSLLTDTIGTEGLGNAMGITSLGWTIAAVMGPLLGGVVYDRAGYFAVYYMAFGLIALDAIMRITIIEKKVARKWLDERPSFSHAAGSEKEQRPATLPQQGCPESPIAGNSIITNSQSSTRGGSRLPPMLTLLSSRRMLNAIWGTLVASAVLTSFDSVLPLHVKAIFGVRTLLSLSIAS